MLSEDANTEEDGGQTTMIRVICSQRDRLKERVSQLGDELSKVSILPWEPFQTSAAAGWTQTKAVLFMKPVKRLQDWVNLLGD